MQSSSHLQSYIYLSPKILLIFVLSTVPIFLLTNCRPVSVEVANPTAAILYCRIQAIDYLQTDQQTQGVAMDRYNVIPNSEVTLNVADRQPMIQTTDTEGITIFLIDEDRINQIGTLKIVHGQTGIIITKTIVLSDICQNEEPIPIRFSKEFIYVETTVPNVAVGNPAASSSIADTSNNTPTPAIIATATAVHPTTTPPSTAVHPPPPPTTTPSIGFRREINLPQTSTRLENSVDLYQFNNTIQRIGVLQPIQARNFSFATDVIIHHTSSETFYISLIFREDDSRNYYMVRFSNQGQVSLYRHEGQTSNWIRMQSAFSATSWNPNLGQNNYLQVDVQDNTLTVQINNQPLLQTEQIFANTTGTVSLAVDGPAEQMATIQFQNVTLTPRDE